MIKFNLIQDKESFDQVAVFAKSFDHDIDKGILPIYTVSKGDNMIGYFSALTQPIICPAFHPRVCSPRDFKETVEALKNWRFLNSISQQFPNGVGFLATDTKIDPAIIQKLGFKNLNMQLYQATP
jgi:hypothetical protein